MNYNELIQQISNHVQSFYAARTQSALLYHNMPHTMDVVDASKNIAGHYNLNDRDFFIVIAAAWFHDTGYLTTGSNQHEEKGAEIAETYLKSIGVDDADIDEIKKCIISTRMPQQPVSLLEKIVCDADLFHLGTEAFKEKSKLLRKEVEAINNVKIDTDEWRLKNLALLESHQYHTEYCRELLSKSKTEQIEKIRKKQQEKLVEKSTITTPTEGVNQNMFQNKNSSENPAANINTQKLTGNIPTEKKPIPKNKKNDRPIRGVETMFRVSSSNHQRLSVMADNKAHIMISVNSIIVSVAIALVVRRLEDNKNVANLIIPTLILLGVNVVTIIYSVLATRPRIPNGIFTKEQIADKSANLLFFGSFYNMGFDEYEEGMREMMNDSEFLYGSLIRDIYSQGKVLGRKYRLLHNAYNVFMYGIAISVIAYALALLVYH